MRRLIIYALTVLLALLPLDAFAQTQLKGRVLDEAGQPVVGAMVLNKANGKWSTTDLDGRFMIEKVDKGNTLEVTCLGYDTASVTYQGGQSLDITIREDSLELEETVVIGYGAVKKKDLTGSVGVLNSSVLEQQSTAQLSQSLQGTVPGLTVTRSSSMPGASATIQVRGVTTLSDSSPLILVDGMAVNSIDNVAPDDVEQITVLKDAASASIYGARAAAGVILITTKGAREGDIQISYNGEFSMTKATEFADYLTDPINYMTMFNEYKWNDAGNPVGGDYQVYDKEMIENYYQNNEYDPITYPVFDWKSAVMKNAAFRHKQSLTMAYGNKTVKTRLSASYEKTDALYPGSSHERMMARSRNTISISRNLVGAVDFSFKHALKRDPQTGSPIKCANMYPQMYLGLYPDGRVAESKTGSNTLGALLNGGFKNNSNDYITGKLSLSYKPIDGLDITASVTPTYSFTKVKSQTKAVPIYDAYDTGLLINYVSGYNTNALQETRSDAVSLETQVVATYDRTFGKAHHFNAMGGYEDYMYTYETLGVSTTEMDLANFPYMGLANPNKLSTEGSSYQNAYRSFFGRVMYNYDGRYYIQANARTDGSSRFNRKYRWGVFPSASLGWVISNEPFMKNVTPVNHLKLRASIGSLGNERIGNYPWQTSISFNKAIMYDANGEKAVSAMTGAQQDYAYENITWETTWSWDAGIDAAFLNNRLDFTADVFYKETRDMLLSVAIPLFTGYSAPERNAGTMYTRGWEFKIGWHDSIGDLRYGIGFNLSDARSIVGNLNGKQTISGGTIITEGEEYKAWYGYKSDGLFQSDADIAGSALFVASTKPGYIKYQDISGADGEPDNIVNATYDRTVLGSSLPHFIYGGNLNLGWKNWSLNVLINGVGSQKTMITEDMVGAFVSQWLASPACLLNEDGSRNYWSLYNTEEQNLKARYPLLSQTGSKYNNYEISDFWMMDGSYLRIKNINLSYTVPSRLLQNSVVKGVKVYLNSDDPFCFDHYLKGWDPEAGPSTYIARTVTLGVDLKF